MSVKFRSLVPGGFYSADPLDRRVAVSIRTNNPGALNVAAWVRAYPGYVGDRVTSDSSGKGGGVNSTVIFETPEHGVAAWWELMRKYHVAGARTVKQIGSRYGGGQSYAAYVDAVERWTGLSGNSKINLDDDATLLPFAKAMFRYEAGKPTPLTDKQIIHGFQLARGDEGLEPPPLAPPAVITTTGGILGSIAYALGATPVTVGIILAVTVLAAILVYVAARRR